MIKTLLTLASTLPDTKRMFGPKDAVDPVRRLIGAASAWGGNPEKDALYLNGTPAKNDGKTVYKLRVKDVPVDGFWSISVYNDKGYFEPNPQKAYTLNNLTAKPDADGSISIQFGGCDTKLENCLPTPAGWNYLVRLYRPRPEILNGPWTFPEAEPWIEFTRNWDAIRRSIHGFWPRESAVPSLDRFSQLLRPKVLGGTDNSFPFYFVALLFSMFERLVLPGVESLLDRYLPGKKRGDLFIKIVVSESEPGSPGEIDTDSFRGVRIELDKVLTAKKFGWIFVGLIEFGSRQAS